MIRLHIIIFFFAIISCQDSPESNQKTRKISEQTWHFNQLPLDSNKILKLTKKHWQLYSIERTYDKPQNKLYGNTLIDSINNETTTFIFHSDGSCELIEKSYLGKWVVVDGKYLGISWNNISYSPNFRGLFSIDRINNKNLVLFKGQMDQNDVNVSYRYYFKIIKYK